MRGCRMVLLLALVGALTGCPKAPVSPAGPVDVQGRAEDADGKPLGQMLLRFHPQDEANKGTGLTCAAREDGSFVGKCLPGRYKVTLAAIRKTPEKEKPAVPAKPPPLPDAIPSEYGSATETPWEVVVPTGGKTNLVLKIK